MHLLQFVYDKLSLVWHNNNQKQTTHNEQLKSIQDLQAILACKSTSNNSGKQNNNGIIDNNNNSLRTKNSGNTNSTTSGKDNDMAVGSTPQNSERQNAKLNDSNRDIDINVNNPINNSKQISKLINEIIDTHSDMQDQINECETLVNITMDMSNLLVSIVETIINNSIDYSISHFERIQTETSTIAYILLCPFVEITTNSDNSESI